jgi:hypothetical protein
MKKILTGWRKFVLKEAYYGSIPGEPETPAGYGGAVDRAKVQQNLSDDIEDLVRFGKLNLDDLSVEIVRANQEIQWGKYQAIDDEVLGDIIRDFQRKRKFYKEGLLPAPRLKKIIKEEIFQIKERAVSMGPIWRKFKPDLQVIIAQFMEAYIAGSNEVEGLEILDQEQLVEAMTKAAVSEVSSALTSREAGVVKARDTAKWHEMEK